MAEQVNRLTGTKPAFCARNGGFADTKKRLPACVDRARELLGYEPRMPVDEGLNKTVAWFKANWEQIQRDAEFPPGMSSAAFGIVAKK